MDIKSEGSTPPLGITGSITGLENKILQVKDKENEVIQKQNKKFFYNKKDTGRTLST